MKKKSPATVKGGAKGSTVDDRARHPGGRLSDKKKSTGAVRCGPERPQEKKPRTRTGRGSRDVKVERSTAYHQA
jgi:hypothetical protein